MTAQPIGVLLAGFCGIGKQDHQTAMYLPALAAHHGFAVVGTVASCPADEPTARRVAAELGVPCHDKLSDALADAGVQAVSVAAPLGARVDVVGETIRAGKHVLADKPLAASAGDVQTIARELADNPVVVLPALHQRLRGSITAARTAVGAGRVGLPWNVQADFLVAGGPPAPGGELLNLGCYPVDVVHALLGLAAVRVHAYVSRRGGADCATLLVDYEHGVTAAILVGRVGSVQGVRPGGLVRHRYRISGSHGVLDVDAGRPALRVRNVRSDGERWMSGDTVSALIDAWYRAIRDGAPPPVTVEDALAVHRVLDAATRSVESGRPEPLGGEPA